MKGTQTEFVAADGSKLLGNSVIEPLAADIPISNSSCITCHSGALFEKTTGVPFTGILNASPVGPMPAYDKSKYASYDFVYGLLTGDRSRQRRPTQTNAYRPPGRKYHIPDQPPVSAESSLAGEKWQKVVKDKSTPSGRWLLTTMKTNGAAVAQTSLDAAR